MKKKTLLTSILAIVMCFSLITGATFALFTSEDKVNVAVTSGKVEVKATVENFEFKTLTKDWAGVSGNKTEFDKLGGSAELTSTGDVVLNKIVPGDGVRFDVKVENNSNVTVKYRAVIKNAADSSVALFNAMDVTVDGAAYNGVSATAWEILTPTTADDKTVDTIKIAMELPKEAEGAELMNQTCKLTVTAEAIQGNAETTNEIEVENAAGLAAAIANGGNVKLTDDVALNTAIEIPTGAVVNLDLNGKTIFGAGVDANGNKVNTIVNNGTMTIKGGTISSTGICGGPAIYNEGNLTLENVTINGAPSNIAAGKTASYTVNTNGDGSTLVVNNANISGRGAIGATNGTKVVINGGTYCTPEAAWGHAVYANDLGTEVTINGGTFSEGYAMTANNWGMYQIYAHNKAKVIVNGGDFSQEWDCANGYDLCTASGGEIVIKGGIFADDPSNQNGKNYVADGCVVVDNENGTYTVSNLNGEVVEIYGLVLDQTVADGESRGTIYVNSKEALLNVSKLWANWETLFTNGQGNSYFEYVLENGGKGVNYYYNWTWNVELKVSVDFEGEQITPINLGKLGLFNGNGNTISNAKIVADATIENHAGLFVANATSMKNLKLDNIQVVGSNVGDSSAGILSAGCNNYISNIDITNSSVTGGKYTGGVIGYGYCNISDCDLTNVTVKGGYKLGGLIGYICASPDKVGNVTGNTLTDCTVDGIGGGVYAGGKDKYIVGKVVGNYNCNGTCKDNIVTNMTTSATANIGKIEDGKVVVEQ